MNYSVTICINMTYMNSSRHCNKTNVKFVLKLKWHKLDIYVFKSRTLFKLGQMTS